MSVVSSNTAANRSLLRHDANSVFRDIVKICKLSRCTRAYVYYSEASKIIDCTKIDRNDNTLIGIRSEDSFLFGSKSDCGCTRVQEVSVEPPVTFVLISLLVNSRMDKILLCLEEILEYSHKITFRMFEHIKKKKIYSSTVFGILQKYFKNLKYFKTNNSVETNVWPQFKLIPGIKMFDD